MKMCTTTARKMFSDWNINNSKVLIRSPLIRLPFLLQKLLSKICTNRAGSCQAVCIEGGGIYKPSKNGI